MWIPLCLGLALNAPGAGPAATKPVRGTVVETMNSGDYTYVCVDSGTERIWAASVETPIHTGDVITIPDGIVMQDFSSPTLGRTFATIRFVSEFQTGDGASMGAEPPHGHGAMQGYGDDAGSKDLPPGHPPVRDYGNDAPKNLPSGHPPISPASPVMSTEPVAIPAGGLAISDVHERRRELKGQEVTVRGRVVKATMQVMGSNWLHLQDGAGTEHDITVTTADSAELGDVVTAKGQVAIDQDYGYGYAYDVVIKNARVTK